MFPAHAAFCLFSVLLRILCSNPVRAAGRACDVQREMEITTGQSADEATNCTKCATWAFHGSEKPTKTRIRSAIQEAHLLLGGGVSVMPSAFPAFLHQGGSDV